MIPEQTPNHILESIVEPAQVGVGFLLASCYVIPHLGVYQMVIMGEVKNYVAIVRQGNMSFNLLKLKQYIFFEWILLNFDSGFNEVCS